MTTTVKIQAHCDKSKQVVVTIMNGEIQAESFTLQDGESADRVVYEERVISIKEVLK